MTHDKFITSNHANQRLKERYNVKPTSTIKKALMKRVLDGRAYIQFYQDDVNMAQVTYNNKQYRFVYNTNTNLIITFFPNNNYITKPTHPNANYRKGIKRTSSKSKFML